MVGISLCDLPRVGVDGGTSSGSERAARGCGAASDGRTGVEVCLLNVGVRFSGSF